ncbi:MAG: serine/threonine-protein kinase [Pirellulales bacterium]
MAINLTSQAYVGSHRLLNQIGTGRHCDVWDAMIDSKSERRAVKVLAKVDAEQIAMMKKEFAVTKDLEHPNVIRIYEYGLQNEHPFVSMEYFPSMNLKQALQQAGVEGLAPKLASILQQAALGLAAFHTHGYVHRDIKPDNYLINDAGKVKLIDFAIAVPIKGFFGKLLSGKTKQISGTRSYMSPEQIRGESLDQRADIYSFGCMAFEMATGKTPFTGTNTNELLNKHLRSPSPPMETYNKNVAPAFSALMKRMLAKKPADRPNTMTDVAAELKAGVLKSVAV